VDEGRETKGGQKSELALLPVDRRLVYVAVSIGRRGANGRVGRHGVARRRLATNTCPKCRSRHPCRASHRVRPDLAHEELVDEGPNHRRFRTTLHEVIEAQTVLFFSSPPSSHPSHRVHRKWGRTHLHTSAYVCQRRKARTRVHRVRTSLTIRRQRFDTCNGRFSPRIPTTYHRRFVPCTSSRLSRLAYVSPLSPS